MFHSIHQFNFRCSFIDQFGVFDICWINAHTQRLTTIWYMHALWHFTRKFCCFLHYMPFAILNVSYTTQIYAYFNTIYHAWAEHVLQAHLFDLNAFLSRSYTLLHICEFNTYVRISPCKYNSVNEATKINKTLEIQTEVSIFLMMLLLLLLLRRYCCIREFTTKKSVEFTFVHRNLNVTAAHIPSTSGIMASIRNCTNSAERHCRRWFKYLKLPAIAVVQVDLFRN